MGDDGDDDSDGVGMDGHAMGVHDGVRVAANEYHMLKSKCASFI